MFLGANVLEIMDDPGWHARNEQAAPHCRAAGGDPQDTRSHAHVGLTEHDTRRTDSQNMERVRREYRDDEQAAPQYRAAGGERYPQDRDPQDAAEHDAYRTDYQNTERVRREHHDDHHVRMGYSDHHSDGHSRSGSFSDDHRHGSHGHNSRNSIEPHVRLSEHDNARQAAEIHKEKDEHDHRMKSFKGYSARYSHSDKYKVGCIVKHDNAAGDNVPLFYKVIGFSNSTVSDVIICNLTPLEKHIGRFHMKAKYKPFNPPRSDTSEDLGYLDIVLDCMVQKKHEIETEIRATKKPSWSKTCFGEDIGTNPYIV